MEATAKAELSGVGGWLAFLVFSSMVLSPLHGYSMLTAEEQEVFARRPDLLTNPYFLHFSQLMWLNWKIGAAASIATGFALWKLRTKSTVRIVIIVWWMAFVLANSIQVYAFNTISGQISVGGEWVGGLIGSSIVLAGWTAYLLRSKRVRSTYTV